VRTATAIIAEDERVLRDELRSHLAIVWPELEIVGEAASGIEALSLIGERAPRVLFLDIQMPGVTGLDIARQMQGRCHIVFVTAYEAHAVAAFEQGAIDYVLKPYDAARLALTVARLKERLDSAPRSLDGLLAELARAMPRRDYLRWINAPVRDSVKLIAVDDVIYFQSDHGYTRVVTEDGESLILRSLKELQEQLDPASFWPIHRSTIVNASAVAGVTRDLRGRVSVKLKNRPEKLTVSEAHEHLFRRM
jgi:DNA-binding LytR/AlgR family response regulator